MKTQYQRGLIYLLSINYILLGTTFMTEVSASLRLFQQVLTIAIFATWLVFLWRTGQSLPRTPLDIPIGIYSFVLLLSATFSQNPRVSFEYLWPSLCHILGFYLLVDVMSRGRQRWMMDGLFMISAVVVIISIIEFIAWYFGYPLLAQFTQSWPQIGGLTLPPAWHKLITALNVSTILGNYTALLIPVVMVWASTTRKRDLRIGLWLLASGLLFTLVFSGSRGALLALGSAGSILVLTWLLKAAVQERAPAYLRPLLRPRFVLTASSLAVIGLVGGILLITLVQPLRSGDRNRLDIWRSAVEMAQDHPLLGAGPFQYGAMLRWYGEPDLALEQDRLVHAHNMPLSILAEGGIAAVIGAASLIVAFLKTWYSEWKAAAPGRKRRLEGILAALVGFAVHNQVDTFNHMQVWYPLLIFGVYTIAGGRTQTQAVQAPHAVPRHSERLPRLLLAGLLITQILFAPVHSANFAYSSALRSLGAGNPSAALEPMRRARAWDPTLALYTIHEAYILGLLANSQPDEYLSEAIAAHEEAQQLNPTWDLGWHNLAALYAQAGDYEKAVEAQAIAITWNPVPAGYHLTLGIYHEALGDVSASTAAFVQALRRSPGLAASAFWTDPNRPERAEIPERAAAALPDEPARALRIATTAGHLAQAADIMSQIDPNTDDSDILRALGDWAIKVNDEAIAPCAPCYFQKATSLSPDAAWLDYTRLAQYALQNPTAADTYQLDAEKLARTALFMMPSAVENWYTLAQIAEDSNADPNTVDSLLLRSVKTGSPETNFAMFVYGRTARMTYLPQGLVPQRTAQQIRPWVELSTRYIASNRYDDARQLLSELVRLAPYEPELRALIATLPE